MKLWIKVLAGVVPGAVILLLSILVCLCCRRRRQLLSNTTAPFEETEGKHRKESFQSALGKLHVSYKSNSSKSSLRFHHLHHHNQQQQSIIQQRPPFNWDDHPGLITEAVEHGWSRFAFRSRFTSSSSAARPTTLLGFCAVCDGGRPQEPTEVNWEVPLGSSEVMQTVRLNPGRKRSSSGPFDDPSSCSLRMSLPLPGPRLGGSSFPQEAYFEITILYLQPQQHRFFKAGKRAKEGEGDHAKLIQEDPILSQSIQESQSGKEEEGQPNNSVISLGLTMRGSPPSRSMPGFYPGSISFNSNGSVYLDGMKLVFESERTGWAEVNRVVGCGFNPSKKNVFFTVDSELVHVIHCNSDVYKSPLYPVLAAAKADVMVLVNLGQRAFIYAPANAHRTPNPCFVRSPSFEGGAAAALSFVDSRELFSMGRIDSELLDITRKRNSNSSSSNGDGLALDVDPDSDLFEITLHS